MCDCLHVSVNLCVWGVGGVHVCMYTPKHASVVALL